nr:MAG TPA: hypothetical protein [Caudoviricetes sp.]
MNSFTAVTLYDSLTGTRTVVALFEIVIHIQIFIIIILITVLKRFIDQILHPK